MKKTRNFSRRASESGNVLFLILIAVALFAALSYAVTQSTRSGGGDASSEASVISGAEVTQYPAGIRTAVVRMIIAGNDVSALRFNSPSGFGGNLSVEVFSPSGGGVPYASAPKDVMANGTPGTWAFNGNFEIENIGSTGGVGANADLIAFLPNIKSGVCDKINAQLGLPTGASVPAMTTDESATYKETIDGTVTFPAATDAVLTLGDGSVGTDTALSAQPFGCFYNSAATPKEYVYFHVVVER